MRTLLVLLTVGLLASLAAPAGIAGPSSDPHLGSYVGPGTIVADFGFFGGGGEASATFVDNGAIVCEDANGDGRYERGRGGLCVRFVDVWGDSLLVEDALAYRDVAFQVCVDMNGDSLCGDGAFAAPFGHCRDIILFSHNSFDGGFDNPMYLPDWLQMQYHACGAMGFPGYIVIMCAGAHEVFGAGAGHAHDVTFGQVFQTWGGSWPRGDYCGAPTAVKAYVLR